MKALLIIDVQNDYFPGGKSELVNPQSALNNIKLLLDFFRSQHLPVIHVQHINNRPGAAFFLPGTNGVEIHEDLSPARDEDVIIKHVPNSFYETGLTSIITDNSIDELVVCGMMTHMCIDTTVRAAKDFSVPITLIYDGCATKDLVVFGKTIPADTVHDSYMAGLNGMFADVKMTGQCIEEI